MRAERTVLAVGLASLACIAGASEPAREVDPFLGTGGHGHTFPGPSLPFGMVQPGPDTRLTGWDGCSGYHFDDREVYGFSHTHLSGTGIADYGDVLLLPATGPVRLRSNYENAARDGYGSRFSKDSEHAEPGYYRVRLEDYGIAAELTATLRTGWHRYRFPPDRAAHVLLDLTHRDEVLDSWVRIVDASTIEGFRRSRAWAADQPVFFVARFSRPIEATLYRGDEPVAGAREVRGLDVKAVLRPDLDAARELEVQVAISAVDVEGARKNLETEATGRSFEDVRAAAREAWNRALGKIEIEGGSPEERRTFYTSLYHALLQPNVFQDVDGRFLGRDGKIHQAHDYTRHTVFSLWDTFRATHPLYTLIERRRTLDFVRTFLAQYREAGRLPVWELWGNETDCMIGYHAVSVIADAWAKGIRDFDAALALEAMVASANGDRFGLAAYREHGYIPADREPDSVSKTLEYAYDDACIARFAEELGRDDVARTFALRAQAWQHLLDPPGFMRPRAEGRFLEPFDPAEVTFHYTEANAWQYSFFVPHDVSGLMSRLGGPLALERRLDALFAADSTLSGRDQPDITGLIGQYAHGNEPSHHMAYLHAFAGAPHKTQAMVHRLLDEMYAPRPDGLVGNADCGQLGAWYVLSALGFYAVTPGTPDWVIGTPRFDRATLNLENGRRFTVRAQRASPGAFYIQSATWNGQPWTRAWLSHDEILGGGELVFELGPQPSRWGSAVDDRPSTSTAGDRVVPAPVAAGPIVASDEVTLALVPAAPEHEIRYTLDGSEPTVSSPRYEAPLLLEPPASVRFRARSGERWSPVVEAPLRRLDPHVKLELRNPFSPQYPAGGPLALVDGVRGGADFRLGTWQGFHGVELEAIVDLGRPRELRRIATGFFHDPGSWIFLPLEVSYETSVDGASWTAVGRAQGDFPWTGPGPATRDMAIELVATRARFVRLSTRSLLSCPAGHRGAGRPAWIFADEIVVE